MSMHCVGCGGPFFLETTATLRQSPHHAPLVKRFDSAADALAYGVITGHAEHSQAAVRLAGHELGQYNGMSHAGCVLVASIRGQVRNELSARCAPPILSDYTSNELAL